MKTKRLIALILCLAMFCTLFAGCGKDPAKDNSGADSSASSSNTDKGAEDKKDNNTEKISADTSYAEFVYVPTYKDIPLPEDTRISRLVFANDKFYLTCEEQIGEQTESWGEPGTDDYQEYTYPVYGTVIYTMEKDFTNVQKFENFKSTTVPEGQQGSCYLNSLTVANDGTVWTFENLYLYQIDDNGDYTDNGNTCVIRHIAADGSDICSIDAKTLFPDSEYLYINCTSATPDGGCIICEGNNNKCLVIDAQGSKLFDIDTTNYYINGFVTLADGNLYADFYGDKGYCLAPVDLTAKKLGDQIVLKDNIWSIIAGDSNYDIYYNNDLSFNGYDLETGTSTTLIKWLSSDIDIDEMNNLCVLPDGTICAVFADYSGENPKFQIATFEKADPSTLPAKITLTLGCMYIDYDVRSAIVKFNRSNDKYRIEIIDYSQYNTEDDYTAGTTKLNTEIISGKAPDILVSSELPMEMYAKKGLFTDLYPLIDADPELNGKLVTDILKALEIDGRLYTAVSNVSYETIVGPASVVGDKMGWTIDELMALQKQMPAGMSIFVNVARSDMLYTILRMNLDSYIDWTTGDCKFDTGEFAKMLEFANTFPLEIDWENGYVDEYSAAATGKCLLSNAYLENFSGLLMYDSLYNGSAACIGFPSENTCGTMIRPQTALAISSSCRDIDGAWQFVRTFFTEEYQTESVWWGFKTNQAAFDADIRTSMEKQMTVDENGNEVEAPTQDWEGDGFHIVTYAPTQADIDKVLALIKAVGESGVKNGWDEDIYSIINEEAEYYFNGQKTASDVANIIQSRVKIYVSEHML